MDDGKYIKAFRKHYGLTQAELGKIAGVSKNAVFCWESNQLSPRMGALEKIARHFNVPKSYIYEGIPSTEKKAELLKLVDSLAEEDKIKLIEYAELLKRGRTE